MKPQTTTDALSISQILGCLQEPLNKNCVALNNQKIAYLSGKHLVINGTQIVVKNIEDDQVRMLHGSMGSICVSLQSQTIPLIKFYRIDSPCSFSFLHTHIGLGYQVTDMICFRGGQNIISLGSNDEKTIITKWSIGSQVPILYVEINFITTKIVGFSKSEDELYTTHGDSIHLFELQGQIRLMEIKSYGKQIRCACKIASKPYAGFLCDQSFVFLRNWDVQSQYPLSFESHPSTMVSYSQGFLVGFDQLPQIDIIEIMDERPQLIKSIQLCPTNFIRCVSIDVAPDEKIIGVTIQSQHLEVLKIGFEGGENEIVNMTAQESHQSSIIAISESIFCNMIITVSLDRQLKCWQVDEDGKLQVKKTFYLESTPVCMDVHPTSFMVAVGSLDNLRIYSLTEQLRAICTKSLKQCSSVQYCANGDRIAVSYNDHIRVFNAYSFETLVVKTFTNQILDFIWCFRSTSLIISTINKMFTCFSIMKECVLFESQPQAFGKVTCFTYDDHNDILVFCTAKRELFTYKHEMRNSMSQNTSCQYNKVKISLLLEVVFFLTSSGSVRIYVWPFTEVQHFCLQEVALHQGPGTALYVSKRGLLITGGQDTCIVVVVINLRQDSSTNIISLARKVTLCYKAQRNERQHIIRDQNNKLKALNSYFHSGQTKYEIELELNSLQRERNLEVNLKGSVIRERMDKLGIEYQIKYTQMEKSQKKCHKDHLRAIIELAKLHDQELLALQALNTRMVDRLDEEYKLHSEGLDQLNLQQQKEIEHINQYDGYLLNEGTKKLTNQVVNYEGYDGYSDQMMIQLHEEKRLKILKTIQEFKSTLNKEQVQKRATNLKNVVIKSDMKHTEQRIKDLQMMFEQNQVSLKNDLDRHKAHEEHTNDIQTELNEIENKLAYKEKEINTLNKYNIKLRLYKKTLEYKDEEQQSEIQALRDKLIEIETVQNKTEIKLHKQSMKRNQNTELTTNLQSQILSTKSKLKIQREQVALKKRRLETIEYDVIQCIKQNERGSIIAALKETFEKFFYGNQDNINFYVTQYIMNKEKQFQASEQGNYKQKLIVQNIKLNDLEVKQSDTKTKLYNDHYANLLEELNELKREDVTLRQDYDDLVAEMNQVNNDIVVMGQKPIPLCAVQSKSLSPANRSVSPPNRSKSPQLVPISLTNNTIKVIRMNIPKTSGSPKTLHDTIPLTRRINRCPSPVTNTRIFTIPIILKKRSKSPI